MSCSTPTSMEGFETPLANLRAGGTNSSFPLPSLTQSQPKTRPSCCGALTVVSPSSPARPEKPAFPTSAMPAAPAPSPWTQCAQELPKRPGVDAACDAGDIARASSDTAPLSAEQALDESSEAAATAAAAVLSLEPITSGPVVLSPAHVQITTRVALAGKNDDTAPADVASVPDPTPADARAASAAEETADGDTAAADEALRCVQRSIHDTHTPSANALGDALITADNVTCRTSAGLADIGQSPPLTPFTAPA